MSQFYKVEDNGTVVVTTSSGWIVECQPVAALLLRVGQNLVEPLPPEPPTYTVIGIGGASEQRPYDQEAADDPKTPDEDRAKWAVYLEQKRVYEAEVARITNQRNEMRGRFMALRGVRVRDLPVDLEAWAEEQRTLFGFEIEDNGLPHEHALRLAFIDNEVIHTAEDGAKITAGIMRASGLDQEALDSVEATFLNTLGRGNGADAGRDTAVPEKTSAAKK